MHITTKYDGQCNDCGEDILAGDKVDWIKGQKGMWCTSCHATSTPLAGGQRRAQRSAPTNGGDSAPLLTTAPLVEALRSLEAAVKQLTAKLEGHEYRI